MFVFQLAVRFYMYLQFYNIYYNPRVLYLKLENKLKQCANIFIY